MNEKGEASRGFPIRRTNWPEDLPKALNIIRVMKEALEEIVAFTDSKHEDSIVYWALTECERIVGGT